MYSSCSSAMAAAKWQRPVDRPTCLDGCWIPDGIDDPGHGTSFMLALTRYFSYVVFNLSRFSSSGDSNSSGQYKVSGFSFSGSSGQQQRLRLRPTLEAAAATGPRTSDGGSQQQQRNDSGGTCKPKTQALLFTQLYFSKEH